MSGVAVKRWQRWGWKKAARLHLKIKEVVRRDIQISANFLDLRIIQLINAVFKAAVLLLRHQHVRSDFLLRQLKLSSQSGVKYLTYTTLWCIIKEKKEKNR